MSLQKPQNYQICVVDVPSEPQDDDIYADTMRNISLVEILEQIF